ncbi:MAG: glycosyltransferase 87 family protein, partial [Gemmataceae bacterium]
AAGQQHAAAVLADGRVLSWGLGVFGQLGHGARGEAADLLLPLERFAGRDTGEAVMMWNPPWTLTLAMPLGALPPRAGQLVWLLLGIAAVGGSAWLVWDCYGGRRDKLWVGFAVAFTFVPTLFVLNTGQISAFLLLGCALFAWCVKRGYPVAAGAAACLIAIKPHLAYLLWPAVGLDAVLNRRWRIVLGGVVTGAIITAVPMAFNPDVWGQYFEAYRSSPVPPSKWVSLTPGVVLRVLLGEDKFWLQFVPMAAGVAWFAWRWKADGRRWEWVEVLPWLVLVSFVTAPYGAWHFDLVLLLLPVLHRAAVYSLSPRGEGRGEGVSATGQHPLTPGPSPQRARGAVAILVAANVVMFAMSHARVDSCWYAWLAPLTLVVYAGTSPRRSAVPVPCEVEVATA